MPTNLSWETDGSITLSLRDVRRVRLGPIEKANRQHARVLQILSEHGDYRIELWAPEQEELVLVEEVPH